VIVRRTIVSSKSRRSSFQTTNQKFCGGSFVEKVSLDLRSQKTQVFLKDVQGKSHTLNFYPNETLLDFKNRVEDRTGIPPDQQRLTYKGRPLDVNEELMKSLEITPDGTIFLLLRLKGGVAK
jgi:hypothetical protein